MILALAFLLVLPSKRRHHGDSSQEINVNFFTAEVYVFSPLRDEEWALCYVYKKLIKG